VLIIRRSNCINTASGIVFSVSDRPVCTPDDHLQIESLGTIKRRNRRKYLKTWDDEIKQLIETNKKSYKKWLNSKKLVDKLEYKRKTALAKREVRSRQRISWDKFVTNLEHDTYRTLPKVHRILKQISKDVK